MYFNQSNYHVGLWFALSLQSLLHLAAIHNVSADKNEKILSVTSLGKLDTKSTAKSGLSSEYNKRNCRGCKIFKKTSEFNFVSYYILY